MLLLAVVVLCGICSGGPARAADLSRYVRYHEMLTYAPVRLPAAAGRSRRSATAPVRLTVHALGRQLPLQLAVDTSVFAPDASYSGPSGSGWPASAAAYRGSVHGQPSSLVLGTLVDGVFAGTIRLADDTLFVERAALHVDGGPEPHSFIYRQRDIVLPGPARGYRACGVGQQQRWDVPATVTGANTSNDTRLRRNAHDNIKQRADHNPDHVGAESVSQSAESVCPLYVETGPSLWKYAFRQAHGSLRRTETFLQSLVVSHVQAVNLLYADAVFDGKRPHRGIQFQLEHLEITDDGTCLPNYAGERSRLCFQHVTAQTFLTSHSKANFDPYCLAFAFSYHDFDAGKIGLAWIGTARTGGPGVCSRYLSRRIFNADTGVSMVLPLSLNTGIVSFKNYGSRVHPLRSQLTLAHEIGHTFGSHHDKGAQGGPCLPGSPGGNYLMYFMAQSGVQENNSKFSPCSAANISVVLDRLATGKYNCLTRPSAGFCGNGLLEQGEQCDCGLTDADCSDRCCFPRTPSLLAHRLRRCQLRPGTQCSPSQGLCCDAVSCQLVTAAVNVTCSAAGDCSLPAVCDGRSPRCPAPLAKANHTLCQGGARVCLSGRCAGSPCLLHGRQQCQLQLADVSHSRLLLCRLGCRDAADAACLAQPDAHLAPGEPCAGDKGICDAHRRCRPLRPAGPLQRLHALLTDDSTFGLERAVSALQWWAVLLLVLLLAVVCALLLRCLALHIPSSNPRRPPARALADTMQAPIATFFGLTGGGDLGI